MPAWLHLIGLPAALGTLAAWTLRSAFWTNDASTDFRLFLLWCAMYAVPFALIAMLVQILVLRRRQPAAVAGWLGVLGLVVAAALSVEFAVERVSIRATAGQNPTPPGDYEGRVLLVGLDGLDPRLLEQLIAQGLLSHFSELMQRGCYGPLQTNSAHSPVVWTTIATGSAAAQHGIEGYTSQYLLGGSHVAPSHPRDVLGNWLLSVANLTTEGAVSANARRQKTVWELLDERRRRSLVLNWWASYPAASTHGIQISNRAVPWGGFQDDELEDVRSLDAAVVPAEVAGRVHTTMLQTVRSRGADGLDRQNSRYFEVRDEIFWRLFETLSDDSFDFEAVYLQGVDTASHAFTHVVFGGNEPDPRPARVPDEEVQTLFGQLVVNAYRRMDDRLGGVLAKLKPNEHLVVVSDHGWEYDGSGHWSRPDGVILAVGPQFRVGARIEGATVFDVLPTLAAILGLPRSEELRGHVLTQMLRDIDVAASMPRVESYGARTGRRGVAERGDDSEHLEKLRSLGYID